MKFLAWCPDDADVDDADTYDRVGDSQEAAEAHASAEYEESAGECGLDFTVAVVPVALDGTKGDVELFNICVEFDPAFTAKRRAS